MPSFQIIFYEWGCKIKVLIKLETIQRVPKQFFLIQKKL